MDAYDSILARWPIPYQIRMIPTRHGETFVLTCGNASAPPLVLLHGSASNSAMWIGDAATYSQNYHIYAVERIMDVNNIRFSVFQAVLIVVSHRNIIRQHRSFILQVRSFRLYRSFIIRDRHHEAPAFRIGIRSFDKKRYYYYAHLRKNFPYNKSLQVGSIVQAGDVIGYLGRTGYSTNENANNIQTSHLHFGLQLIFDESQKEAVSEIWVDCYDIIQFLYKNRSETVKDPETKEYHRKYQFADPVAEHYINHSIYQYDEEEFKIHICE
jgi:hypothetical protein